MRINADCKNEIITLLCVCGERTQCKGCTYLKDTGCEHPMFKTACNVIKIIEAYKNKGELIVD
jgi:hypothetical protein